MKHKRPNPNTRFSFAIIPGEDGAMYRLFRRDFDGRIHYVQLMHCHGMDRSKFAQAINSLRHELRNRVDHLELTVLGITS